MGPSPENGPGAPGRHAPSRVGGRDRRERATAGHAGRRPPRLSCCTAWPGLRAGRASVDGIAAPRLSRADLRTLLAEISNWGRWGADDERGTLNLLTPARTLAAARLVR